jgi:hypothetical protein
VYWKYEKDKNEMNNMKKLQALKDADEYVVVINEMNAVVVNVIFVNVNQPFRF